MTRRVPVGSVPVLAAVVASALSAYAALAVATRSLDRTDVPALTTFWALCFLIGPAAFLPVEQAFGSEAARRASSGLPAGGLLRPAFATVALIAGAVGVLALASYSYVVDELLDGNRSLLYAVLATVCGYGLQHIARATLLAQSRFGRYAVVIALDGGLRLAGCLALAATGSESVVAYAWVIALAPGLATLCAVDFFRSDSAETAGGSGLLRSALMLLVGSIAAQALVCLGPLVVKATAPPFAAISASAYLVNASLAQAPLLLGQALLSPLLAELSRAVGRHDRRAFGAAARRLLSLIVVAGAVAVAAITALAPVVVRLVFGADLVLPRTHVAGLGLAGLLFLLAHALTQAAVAAELNRLPGVAWIAGLAAFSLTLWLSEPTPGRVIVAAVAGGVVTVAALTVGVLGRLTAGTGAERTPAC